MIFFFTMGAFLVTDNRYICSLAPLALLTRSGALHIAWLALFPHAILGLAHSPHSNICVYAESEINRSPHDFLLSLETPPME